MTTNPTPVVVIPDVCCAPGIAFSADADSVDCVVSRRPVAGRGRVDGQKMSQREHSCTARRADNLEQISILDSPSAFETMHSGLEVFGSIHHRRFQHRSPEGLTEELLELGDRIRYVNTGLREDEIFRCLMKTKHSNLDVLPSHFPTEMEWKCFISQEQYEADDEVGKLGCGHNYHICCIKPSAKP